MVGGVGAAVGSLLVPRARFILALLSAGAPSR